MDRVSYTELDVKESERGSDTFQCPNCHTHLQFKVRVKVGGVYVQDFSEEDRAIARENLRRRQDSHTPEERALIDEAKASGVFAPFVEAVKQSGAIQPKDYEKYFLTFLSKAERIKAPQFALRMCLEEGERAGSLELWTWQHASAILADGAFRQFIPTKLVKGEPVKTLRAESGKPASAVTYPDAKAWVKTRFGYVAGRGLMLGELRKRAAGDFAKATGNF